MCTPETNIMLCVNDPSIKKKILGLPWWRSGWESAC